MLHVTSPRLFCNRQFALLNPLTFFTQPPNTPLIWQPSVLCSSKSVSVLFIPLFCFLDSSVLFCKYIVFSRRLTFSPRCKYRLEWIGLDGRRGRVGRSKGTQWQVDAPQAWWLSETIYEAALNHIQETGAASVTQVSKSREANLFCVTGWVLYFRASLFWGLRGGLHGLRTV